MKIPYSNTYENAKADLEKYRASVDKPGMSPAEVSEREARQQVCECDDCMEYTDAQNEAECPRCGGVPEIEGNELCTTCEHEYRQELEQAHGSSAGMTNNFDEAHPGGPMAEKPTFIRYTVNLHPEIALMVEEYHVTTGRKSVAGTVATLIGLGLAQQGFDLARPATNQWGGSRKKSAD